MKKFKYRAESYLKFVRFKREEALRELKKAQGYRDNLVAKYYKMEEQMKQAFQFNSEIGQKGRDIHRVNDSNQFIQMLKINMQTLSQKIQQAEEQYQDKRQSLLEVQLKVRKMELHKESELEKFKKEYRKKAQKLTDEINGTRKRGRDAESL